MPIFTINGQTTDNINEAHNMVRDAWTESKKEAVAQQKHAALSKPSLIDLERAAAGITAADVSTRIEAGGGAEAALGRINSERARADAEARANARANEAVVEPPPPAE